MNKYTKVSDTSYCLGMSLTIEALKHRSDYVKEVILSNKAIKNYQLEQLFELCNKYNITYRYDDLLISKLSNKENCYCIGIFDKFYTSLKSNNHVILYGFSNYGDLGTTIRSSISFDFKDIVLIDSDIDYFDPRCVRASMGSIFLANIVRYKDIESYLNDYNNNLYPFTSNGKVELNDVKLKEPFSLVIPENYKQLDNKFKDSYYIKHNYLDEISLSIRSSIILSESFHQISNDKNI